LPRIEVQFVDQPSAIFLRPGSFQALLVPIADLGAEEHAEHDDQNVDPDCEPVVRRDMLANAAYDHRRLPQLGERNRAFAGC
jgi:hypothetical protein